MRILFLALDINLSRQRGDTIHAIELVNALSASGNEVAFVVGADGPLRDRLSTTVTLHSASGSDRSILLKTRLILRSFHPDMIYERRFSPKIGVVLKTLSHTPLALEINGILDEELALQGRSRAPSPITQIKDSARRKLFGTVDCFVAVTDAIASDMTLRYGVDPGRMHVVGNGVNTELFRPLSKMEACRKLGLSPEPPRIVFVGNLAPWEDFDALFQAYETVRDTFPSLELVIVGDGQERSRLEPLARRLAPDGRIRLFGEVPYREVPWIIGAGDLGVVTRKPGQSATSPLKLFEYAACARAVVASNVPGLSLVEQEGLGRLAVPGDSEHLASQLCASLCNPTELREMGLRGRSFVERERSWTGIAVRIVAILSEIVEVAG